MRNFFCSGRAWQILIVVSIFLSPIAFAQTVAENSANASAEMQTLELQEVITSENATSQPSTDTNPLNISDETPPISNPPINDTNETPTSSETNNTIPISKPILNIDFAYPEKLTRGEDAEIKTVIMNTGSVDVNKVILKWFLPDGFEKVSEQGGCDSIAQNSSCESKISVKSSLSTDLGLNEIKIVVNYGY